MTNARNNSTRLTNSRCARVVGRAGDRLRAVVMRFSSDGDNREEGDDGIGAWIEKEGTQ